MYTVLDTLQTTKNNMARITVSAAAKQFNVSRTTLYKLIKEGQITRDSENKLDVSDLVRLFSIQNKPEPELTQIDTLPEHQETSTGQNQQALLQEIEHLKQQVALLEAQLEYVKANETWLKQQLDQKLLEHKSYEKKGLFGRLFK